MWWHEVDALQNSRKHADAGLELQVDPTATIAESAILDTLRGPIVIGPRTRVCAGAHIVGPVEIGGDCLIGNNCMVRGTTRIGDGVRIGFATEIKGSIIERHVTIGPQCFVADSKVETGAYLGAQVRTSNHRLDKMSVSVRIGDAIVDTGLEKLGCLIGARAALGIQVIILPGREVAPDSLFAPRITIEKNLPSGRYRHAQQIEAF